ncbi:hypothetical protein [Pseudomonas sp. LB3P14]
MSTLRVRHEPTVFSVGGRLYRLADYSPTCVRLQDVLEGYCLSFTRAEVLQMIAQQDLITLRLSTLKHGCPTDPRYRQYLPDWAQGDAPERRAEAAELSKQTTRRPAVIPCDTPNDESRSNDAVTHPCRYAKQLQQFLARSTRPGYPARASMRLIILDEVSYFQPPAAVTREQSLILHKIYAQASRLCPDFGGIARGKQSEKHSLSERRSQTAPIALGGRRLKKPTSTFITLHLTQREQPAVGLARLADSGAVQRAEWRRAVADRGLNSTPDAEVDDVE